VRLDLHLADGRVKSVTTDRTWRSTTNGPIRGASIYDGETLDARREKPGWDTPRFDDTEWNRVKTVEFPDTNIVWQPNRPVRVTRELTPVKITEPEPDTYVFDMGQNMVGWCRLRVDAPPGTEITLRHGERLKDDGTVYIANLRGAEQLDTFICGNEGRETFEPHFTYHGFRYVQVEGLPDRPEKEDLVGRVFRSAAPRAGRFECSNELINQLMKNILWTQRGNLTSVPTDCPQRDERLGWMGDIQAFSQTAIFNMDMAGFFTKWLRDVRDCQCADGRFPRFAPSPHCRAAPAWGDGGVIIPWRVYVNYGDTRLVRRHFEAARRWVDFVHNHNSNLIWRNERQSDPSDWLNGDTLKLEDWPDGGASVPRLVFATAFFAHSAELVGRMAEVLDRPEDARVYGKLAEDIRKAFRREFVNENARIEGDTQAGYALALRFGLLTPEQASAARAHISRRIERYGGHLSTGIQSTHRMMLELSRRGHHDEACRLINQRTVPSWGYMIEQGATTVWERWDGYVEGRGMQDPGMNSFNHWAFGSVGEWVWRNVVGINPDPERPGYRHVIIRPRPCDSFTWARGTYRSIRGPITVDWRIENGRIRLKTVVPPNATATVHVPTSSPSEVRESGQAVSEVLGVEGVSNGEDGYAAYEIDSGHYVFTAPAPETR
jgi:alpha-L-rhamnosidase